MFGKLKGLMGNVDAMKQAQGMRNAAKKMEEQLKTIFVEEEGGGGLVFIKVNCKKEILEINIDENKFANVKPAKLSEHLTTTLNRALKKADEIAAEEMKKLASTFMMG